jgi:hypothetical protein
MGGVRDDIMQMRSKAYLQIISRLRVFCGLTFAGDNASTEQTSPLLVYIAVSLSLLLAILEADLQDTRLLGFLGDPFSFDPLFGSH